MSATILLKELGSVLRSRKGCRARAALLPFDPPTQTSLQPVPSPKSCITSSGQSGRYSATRSGRARERLTWVPFWGCSLVGLPADTLPTSTSAAPSRAPYPFPPLGPSANTLQSQPVEAALSSTGPSECACKTSPAMPSTRIPSIRPCPSSTSPSSQHN